MAPRNGPWLVHAMDIGRQLELMSNKQLPLQPEKVNNFSTGFDFLMPTFSYSCYGFPIWVCFRVQDEEKSANNSSFYYLVMTKIDKH